MLILKQQVLNDMLLNCLNVLTKISTRYDLKTLFHENGVAVDLYLNQNPYKNVCIYFLYGGRWTSGTKEEFQFIAHKFLRAGYHVAIADHRKFPQTKFPDFVHDAANGCMAVHKHFGSSANIIVMGHSSGAHLGAMLCTDPQYLEASGGNINLISGFIGISGPYKFIDYIDGSDDLPIMFGPPEKYPDSQPVFLAEKADKLPPMLLIHGEKDKDVLPLNSITLAGAAKHAGKTQTLMISRLGHIKIIMALGLPFWPKQTKTMMNAIDNFIGQQVSEALAAPIMPQAQVQTPKTQST